MAFMHREISHADQAFDRPYNLSLYLLTGLLALQGYPDGYRAGAKHAHNPYQKEMTPEQVAHVNKALGLPEPVQPTATARASETKQPAPASKDQKKSKRSPGKTTAEASARD